MVARPHPRGPAIIDLSVEQYAEKMPLIPDPGRHKSLLMCHDHLQQDGLTLTRDMTGDRPLKSFPCYTPEIGERRSDRSIPHEELMALARESISANGFVLACGLKDMLAVGYSSGAIFGTALLALAPENFVGAILLRPQPISDDFTFPELSGKPVLIISGLRDNRREPQHASQVAEQLIAANAVVTHHALDSGHGWAANDDDLVLARSWMDENFPT